jgi:dTDP-4-dehydrorhamnose reductase
MKNILVTGGNGQLASCIRNMRNDALVLNFIFADSSTLDITKYDEVKTFFKEHDIAYCINCAAYTAVDKAETEYSLAKAINCDGPKNIALACKDNGAVLFHISTDFVFDGEQSTFYTEQDKENPLSVYGETKLLGEKAIRSVLKKHFIIRTSWLYSEYGNNFLKTMLKLGSERNQLKVVSDQIGTPTYAKDLAELLVKLITTRSESYGLYHYSNEGVASWYDFAKAIFEYTKTQINVIPIKTESFPTAAKRPTFSVMDKSKIKTQLKLAIPYWKESMKECLDIIADNDLL